MTDSQYVVTGYIESCPNRDFLAGDMAREMTDAAGLLAGRIIYTDGERGFDH